MKNYPPFSCFEGSFSYHSEITTFPPTRGKIIHTFHSNFRVVFTYVLITSEKISTTKIYETENDLHLDENSNFFLAKKLKIYLFL